MEIRAESMETLILMAPSVFFSFFFFFCHRTFLNDKFVLAYFETITCLVINRILEWLIFLGIIDICKSTLLLRDYQFESSISTQFIGFFSCPTVFSKSLFARTIYFQPIESVHSIVFSRPVWRVLN